MDEVCFEQGVRNGELKPYITSWPNANPYGIFRSGGNNVNHVHPVNGTDADSKTRAEIEGRKSAARIANGPVNTSRSGNSCTGSMRAEVEWARQGA